ncbi:MAG: hypothetical protein M1835_004584 [Candelina submexicana]|nr:MAG: hypothetical protein M1835_004584 [Candelina submexicana]
MVLTSSCLSIILGVFLIYTSASPTEPFIDSSPSLGKREVYHLSALSISNVRRTLTQYQAYIICPSPLPPAGVDYPTGYSPKNFHDLTELCQDAGCHCSYNGRIVCERSRDQRYGATAPELYDGFHAKCGSARWCHCMLPGDENRVPIAGNIPVPGYTDLRGPGANRVCLAGIGAGWCASESSCCKGYQFVQQKKLVNAVVQYGANILGTIGNCQPS